MKWSAFAENMFSELSTEERRKLVLSELRHKTATTGVLSLCEKLRMTSLGSNDSVDSDEFEIIREYLLERLQQWKERSTNARDRHYDDLVRSLILSALEYPKPEWLQNKETI